MFLGTFEARFSGKGRLIFPKLFREEVKEEEIILTKGLEGCIWGFAQASWEKEASRYLEVPLSSEEGRRQRRQLFPDAVLVKLDRQYRFIIPDTLLKFANLQSEVLIVGTGDHFEVWEKERWQKLKDKYARKL